jgi:phenylacetate-CoA ligase
MIHPALAKRLYILTGRARGENIDRHLEALKKSQWLTLGELQEMQWRKVVSLLHHAFDNSPFYKRRFNEQGITPKDIQSPSDMVKLQLLTKSELKTHFSDIMVSTGAYRYSVAKTSGSTGLAMKFNKDRNASGHGRAAMYRGHSWYGVDIGDREARLGVGLLNLREKTLLNIGDYLLNRFRIEDYNLSEENLSYFFNKIERFKPQYLMGFSSMIYQFAQYLETEKINTSSISFKMVKVTAETIHDYQKNLIQEIFHCPVVNEYGAAEVGVISFECPYHSYHITSENVFVEEMNSEIESKKELVITELNNYLSPIIRYRIGDFARLSNNTCQCGRGLPVLEKIEGRISDIVYKTDGSPVHSSIFSYVLKEITGRDGGIKQYKIHQVEKGRLRIDIVKSHAFSEATTTHLKNILYKQLGREMNLDVHYVEQIPREPSGKLRYFVSSIQ